MTQTADMQVTFRDVNELHEDNMRVFRFVRDENAIRYEAFE